MLGKVTWGDAAYGGDCSEVRWQLRDVQKIRASQQAFAAICADGAVVTWGCSDRGGDSSKVQEELTDVREISASQHAFAALRGDLTVVTWGPAYCGGDSSKIKKDACLHLNEGLFLMFSVHALPFRCNEAPHNSPSKPARTLKT